MSKAKQYIQKEFMKRGYNVDFTKKNGQYNVYRSGMHDGYFINLSCAKDYLGSI